MKQVSIIIVTYNSEKDIFDCVRSIQDHADIPLQDIELIIVDNCSKTPEPMFEQLRHLWGENIILIENTANGGYGQGNNVGIHHATAPIIMIMNPDVRLMMPLFVPVLNFFQQHPSTHLIGMKQMLTPSTSSHFSVGAIETIPGRLALLLQIMANKTNLFISKWLYISGACFFVRKDKFITVGAFDEDNFMYGEEEDISWRLQRKFGKCIKYLPFLRYIHLMDGRQATIKTDLVMIKAQQLLYQKKGVSPDYILRQYIKRKQALLWLYKAAKCVGKCTNEQIQLLSQEIKDLNNL